jgi:hypothetical protein
VVGPYTVLTSIGGYLRYRCVGSAIQNASAFYGWSCAPGPFLVLPSPIPAPPPSSTPGANGSPPSTTSSPTPSANASRTSTPLGAIIGGTISGLVVFALVAALLLRRRRQRSKNTNYNAPETDALRHPTSADSSGPMNVYTPDVEDTPSPSLAAYAPRAADMKASTSHAVAGIIPHPPAEPPIPLEQSHTTMSEVVQVARAEPPPTISVGAPTSSQHETELSPSQFAVVRRLAEHNVPAPTLAALINSLIGETEGGAEQINQRRQAGPSQRTASSPLGPVDPPPQYDFASP